LSNNLFFAKHLSDFIRGFFNTLAGPKNGEYYIPENSYDKIVVQLKKIEVDGYEISKKGLKVIEKILEDCIKGDEIYKKLVDEMNTYVKDYSEGVKYYKEKGKGIVKLNYNDCLFLTLSYYSDHLPQILELEY